MRSWSPVLVMFVAATGCAAGTDASPSPIDAASTSAPHTTAIETTDSTHTSSTTPTQPTTTTALVGASIPAEPPKLEPFDAWIAVLASLPVGEYTQDEAEDVASAAAANILLSDDYGSLNPGYWVVYHGAYDFAWEAEAACPTAVTDCYSRYLAAIKETTPIGHDTGTAIAVTVDGELVVLSTPSGAVARTLDRGFGGDGSYPGAFSLAGDGRSVYYTIGFEDFWFSCDASDGTLLQYDFAAGRSEQIGDGFSPDVSDDDRYLLYLAASQCYPDPNEAQWVLAPIDTVVRRDLATGNEDRMIIELSGDVAAGYELWSAVWGPREEALIMDTDGILWRLAPGSGGNAWRDEVERIGELESGLGGRLVGWDAARDVLLYTERTWRDDEVTTSLRGFDPDGPASLLVTVAGEAAFALDYARQQLLTVSVADVEAPGTTVTTAVDVVVVDW